jgi:hypothetical protein
MLAHNGLGILEGTPEDVRVLRIADVPEYHRRVSP